MSKTRSNHPLTLHTSHVLSDTHLVNMFTEDRSC